MTASRRAVALAAALVVLCAVLAGGAFASARSTTVGDPQPELAPFSLGAIGSGAGSGVVLPNGDLVLASLAPSGTSAVVCVVSPGGKKCSSSVTLRAYSAHGQQDLFSGVPQVVATGGSDVAVVLEDCCAIPAFSGLGGAVVFESTNDAATFSPAIPAGTIRGVDAASLVDGEIVVASAETTSLNVQSLSVASKMTVTAPVHPDTRADGDTSLSTYDGGLVVASDDTRGDTLVEFAPRASNLNRSSSYRPVGAFDGEDLAGVSGNALLTYSSTPSPGVYLRFFNGASFGPRYRVPLPEGSGEGLWSVEVTDGLVHVFFLDKSQDWAICSESTRNGVRWSQTTVYGPAETAGGLVPVLGPSGAGLIFETNVTAPPSYVQPVLDYQAVAIKLARLRAPAGRRTTLTGDASPALAGQAVTLERRISAGQWANISLTHESPAGAFSFTVPGVSDAYRVMVASEPGYYLIGYSNVVLLTAVAPDKTKA